MSSPQADAAAQLLYPPNVQYNAGRVYTIKFLAACFAGAVAGILGLENWLGFALFLSSTALTSSCLYIKCKGRPAKYMPGGLWELVNPGQENLFSFLLVWTLFYGAYASAANDVTLTESRALKPGIVHGMSLFCDLRYSFSSWDCWAAKETYGFSIRPSRNSLWGVYRCNDGASRPNSSNSERR